MMAIPMDRVSGSSVARRSCSLRWSASDVTSLPPRFSNGRSSRVSVETGVRSSAWSKITELRSKGRSSARSPSTVVVSADTGSAGAGVGGGSADPSAEVGAGPSAPVDGKLLEQRVFLELLPDDLLELERGELQELDGLLEQRRHDDPLCLP